MNAERLHRILIDLNTEIDEKNFNSILTNVQTHLQNQVSAPQDPNHQKKLVQSLNNLKETLKNSTYNDYSPSWKQIINEIGGKNLFGVELEQRIEEIFARNQITPANALEEIKQINNTFTKFQEYVKQAISSLTGLHIGKEELEEGQCEFGYSIPRDFVDNKLANFEDEIHELNFILNSLSEAITGKKQDYDVKTISSSDFLLYIIIGLQVADILSKATERILSIYKQILEIKKLRNELKEQGVPATKTKGIETHANSMMEKEIKKIAKEIIDDNYNGEEGRSNELNNAVTFALNKLANRIDNGFNVEIRIKALPEPEEDEETELTDEDIKKYEKVRSIIERSKKIEYIKSGGKSILELPEGKKK